MQTAEEKARWEDIKKTFKHNQAARGGDANPGAWLVE